MFASTPARIRSWGKRCRSCSISSSCSCRRPPRDVDVERVIENALETGTFLEINGQPDRLDLRDVHARAAKEAGLKLIVSSDGHEVRSQAYVELAIAQARRGWLTKQDVVNTRTWKQLEKLRRQRL